MLDVTYYYCKEYRVDYAENVVHQCGAQTQNMGSIALVLARLIHTNTNCNLLFSCSAITGRSIGPYRETALR
jgi:hypothetical protein